MIIVDDGTLVFDELENCENIQSIDIYYIAAYSPDDDTPTEDQKKLNIQINGDYEIERLTIGDNGYYGDYGCDVTLSGTGSLTCRFSGAPYDCSSLYLHNGSSLTIDGPSVTAIAADSISAANDENTRSYGVHLNESTLTVSSGELIATGGTANGNAGSFSAGIYADNSIITINGGEVTATGGTASGGWTGYSAGICADNSTITINGGEVTAASGTANGNYGSYSAGLLALYSDVTIGSDAKILFQGNDSGLSALDDEYVGADDIDLPPSTITINGAALSAKDIADLSANKTFEQSPDSSDTSDRDEKPVGFTGFMMLLLRAARIDTLITGEGTVTHDGTSTMATRGKVRTYTITPADGWMIADVIYEGESLGAVDSVEIVPEARRSTLEVIFAEIAEETEE